MIRAIGAEDSPCLLHRPVTSGAQCVHSCGPLHCLPLTSTVDCSEPFVGISAADGSTGAGWGQPWRVGEGQVGVHCVDLRVAVGETVILLTSLLRPY